jgi:Bacterial protein of unknown function (DUF937)
VGVKTLLKANGADGIQALASAFGIDRTEAEKTAASLGEALSQRIERNALSRGGVAEIVGLLGNTAAARAAYEQKNLASGGVADAGNGVLDVLIGNKHISRGIAARTAAETGVSEDVVKKMLPVVASMMIGGLQRQAQPEFNRLIRNVPELAMSLKGSPLPLPGEVPMDSGPAGRGGSPGSDTVNDRQPPARPAQQQRPSRPISGGSPLPLPGDSIPGAGRDAPDGNAPDDNSGDSPYSRLPDIIRRGGVEVPGGGTLENVIRTILAGLLGYKSRGLLGSLFQMFLIRFLPAILKGIFSRVTGRG